MNAIVERTNSLTAIKACCLLLNVNTDIGKISWLEAFNIWVYILNQTPCSPINFDTLLQGWFWAYNGTQYDYFLDLSHLRTFGCLLFFAISLQKRIKSQKIAQMRWQKRYFIGYTLESIWQVYFSDTQNVQIVRDLEFVDFYEYDDLLEACLRDGTSYFLQT